MAAVAGIDVAKASLDVSVSEGSVVRFENTAKGITKLTSAIWPAACRRPK